MTLTSQIKKGDIPWLEKVQNERVNFLVALDGSGSMAGRPWQQVQNAVQKISKLVDHLNNVYVSYLIYNEDGGQVATNQRQLSTRKP